MSTDWLNVDLAVLEGALSSLLSLVEITVAQIYRNLECSEKSTTPPQGVHPFSLLNILCITIVALKEKIANLSEMYTSVKQATEDRNSALEKTLDASEDFWTGLDDVKQQLQDVGGTLDTQDMPALDPDHIKQQQDALQVTSSII